MEPSQNLTIRLSPHDNANVNAIALAMRNDSAPFITRSAVIKLALAAVAAEPQRFLGQVRPPDGRSGGR